MKFLTKIFNSLKSQDHRPKEITLKISSSLKEFVENEVLPGLDISPHYFWSSFESIYDKFSKRNKDLLEKRLNLQEQISDWHIKNRNLEFNIEEYKKFLFEIGYLHPRSDDFSINTYSVDPEIRKIAGPQLVVPVMNARFALNAANARWGSLYDALYGTNIISEDDGAERVGGYNPLRGNKVIAFAKDFLDKTVPLQKGTYDQAIKFEFIESELSITLS
jgi:malate synthase